MIIYNKPELIFLAVLFLLILLLLRAWLRWASEWGGQRVEEGVPGVQKTRRSLQHIPFQS